MDFRLHKRPKLNNKMCGPDNRSNHNKETNENSHHTEQSKTYKFNPTQNKQDHLYLRIEFVWLEDKLDD